MTEATSEKNIPFNLYKGPENGRNIFTSRGIPLINSTYYIRKEGERIQDFFDLNLKKQLERVKASGGNNLVLLDIGSGEGTMLAGLWDNPNSIKQSIQFLRENPDFKIRAIGLTDSPDESHQGKEKYIPLNENPSDEVDGLITRRIDIRNYFWTLSEKQDLSTFFKRFNVDKVDLVYATEVFQYLPPGVFGKVIDTVSEKLNSGGQLFCSRFSDAPSEFVSYITDGKDNQKKMAILKRENGVSVDFFANERQFRLTKE